MAEAAEGSRALPARWKRRLWKVARVAAIVVAALGLLVLLLPAILTILPLEGTAGRRISSMTGTETELRGFAVGWFRPMRVQELSIRLPDDPPDEPLLDMRGLHIEGGLLRLGLSSRRPVNVRVESLSVNLRQDEDGNLVLPEFPEAPEEPDEPEPDPDEPLEIHFAGMIPSVPVPVGSIDLRVEDFSFRLRDAAEPENSITWDESRLDLIWEGANEPLTLQFPGRLTTARGSLPVVLDASMERWIFGGYTTPRDMRAAVFVKLGAEAREALRAQLRGEQLGYQALVELDAQAWLLLTRLFAEDVPELTAVAHLSVDAFSQLDGDEEVSAKFVLRDAALRDWGPDGNTVPLPTMELDFFTAFPRDLIRRERLMMSMAVGETKFDFQERFRPGGFRGNVDHHFGAWNLEVPAGEWTALARELFPEAGIPAVEAVLSMDGEVELRDLDVWAAKTNMRWQGEHATWDEPPEALAQWLDGNNVLPLSPLDFGGWVEYRQLAEGRRLVVVTGAENLGRIGMGVTLEDGGKIRGNGDLVFRLGGLSEVRGEMLPALFPEATLDGEATADFTFEYDEPRAGFTFDYQTAPLTFALAGEQDIVYTDEWNGHLTAEGAIGGAMELAASWNNRFQEFSIESNLDGPHPALTTWRQDLRFGDLAAALPDAFEDMRALFPEGLLQTEGSLALSEEMEAELQLSMVSPEELLLPVVEGLQVPAALGLDVSARARPEEEGWAVPDASVEFFFADWLSGNLHASMPNPQPDNLRADLAVIVEWEPLAYWAFPVLEWFELGEAYAAGTTRLQAHLEGADTVTTRLSTELDEVLHENAGLYTELAGLRMVQELSARAVEDGAMSFGFGTDGDLEQMAVNGSLLLAGIGWVFSHEFDGGANVHTVDLEHLGWEALEWAGEDGMGAALGALGMAFRASWDAGTDAVTLDELTLHGPDWLDVALSGEGDLGDQTFTTRLEHAEAELAGIAVWLPGGGALDWEGTLRAEGEHAFSGAPGGGGSPPLVPFTDRLRLDTSWDGVAVAMPDGPALGGTAGTATLGVNQQGVRFTLANRMDTFRTPDAEDDLLAPLGTEMEIYLDREDRLYMQEGRLELETLGTELFLRGRVDGLLAMLEDGENAETPMADRLLALPLEVFLGHRQNAEKLAVLDGIQQAGGRMETWLRMEHSPGRWLRVGFDQRIEDLTLDWMGELVVEDASAEFDHFSEIYTADRAHLNSHMGSGRYMLPTIAVRHPAAQANIGEFLAVLEAEGPEFTGRFESAEFFGGTARGSLRLGLAGGDPVLTARYSLTGIDGVSFFERLEARTPGRRNFDAFGSLQLVLPEDPSIRGLLDQLTLRMDVTAVSTDLLREALRFMDREGGNPGIQATLAASRFSSPRSAVLEVRGGLLNVSIVLSTPAGVNFTIPLFERAGIATLLDAWLPAVDDAGLRAGRNFLRLTLASELEEWTRLLQEGMNTP